MHNNMRNFCGGAPARLRRERIIPMARIIITKIIFVSHGRRFANKPETLQIIIII